MKRKSTGVDLKPLTKEKLTEILNDEVFINIDFNRHIRETAAKQNIEVETAETVIKHLLSSIGAELSTIKKHKRRFLIFTYIYLEIIENKYNIFSINFKKGKR